MKRQSTHLFVSLSLTTFALFLFVVNVYGVLAGYLKKY